MKTLALLLLMLPTAASPAVVDSTANGFTIKITVPIEASPDEVYRKLVHNVGDWWSSDHAFSHDAHNLSMEEKINGCFCEKFPGGGAAVHLEIVQFTPGKLLVLHGALGPMQALAATGSMTIEFKPGEGGSTQLDVTYAVGGYLARGLNTFAPPVDRVLTEQFTRLKNYVEKGKP